MVTSGRLRALFSLLLTLMVVGACGLPRTGPTTHEILASSVENGGTTHIVYVDDRVTRLASAEPEIGFSRAFLNAGNASVDRINAGDKLTITIWENVDNGLLANTGSNSTTLPDVQVDQLGNIFVPYAGVVRASGRTSEELRVEITRLLERQTPDPQVEVRRASGDGSTVSIVGGVATQGVYPIVPSTRRLLSMLATAGGVSLNPDVTQLSIHRGNNTARIWLQDLYDNPAYNIALHAGDEIVISQDRRYFTALGSTTAQKKMPFDEHSPNAVDALASIGGLNGTTANPRGVFVFRVEPASVANALLNTDEFTSPQRVAYVIDLTREDGIFIARNFNIINHDAIFVTQAPFVQWSALLQAVAGTAKTVDSLATIVESF